MSHPERRFTWHASKLEVSTYHANDGQVSKCWTLLNSISLSLTPSMHPCHLLLLPLHEKLRPSTALLCVFEHQRVSRQTNWPEPKRQRPQTTRHKSRTHRSHQRRRVITRLARSAHISSRPRSHTRASRHRPVKK